MILIVAAILVCIFAALWTYARWEFGSLEKLGVSVVEYTNPILGSAREQYLHPGGPQDIEWIKKYGRIFGFYEGRSPMLMLAEPELVKEICVKNVSHFEERRSFEWGDTILNQFPDFTPAKKWKVVHTLYSTSFSPAKLRPMAKPMREATLDFVGDLKQKIKEGNGVYEKVPIDGAVIVMLSDLIMRALFSVKVSDRVNNDFANLVQKLVILGAPGSLQQELVAYSHSFPLIRRLMPYSIFNPAPVQEFARLFEGLLDERRKSGQKKGDLLDLCVEWWDRLGSPEFEENGINEHTLHMTAITLFVGGQDPISTMIAGVIYHMTQDPDLEKKIYEEVDAVFEKHNGILEHEHLTELKIVHAALLEARRLYPSFHRSERICTKDWKNEKFNLNIPKGTVIQFPIWAMNRDPKYNPNSDKFDYTRFMPENADKLNIFTSTSHGHGPRMCKGRPFAQDAMPLILAYMLRELKFKGRKDSGVFPVPGGFFFTPHEPIYVDVLERKRTK